MNSIIRIATSLAFMPLSMSAATLDTTVSQDTFIRNDSDLADSPQNGNENNELLFGSHSAISDMRVLVGFDVSQIVKEVNTAGGGNFKNLTINSASITFYDRRGALTQKQPRVVVNAYDHAFVDSKATWNAPGTGDTEAGGSIGSALGAARDLDLDSTFDNEELTVSLSEKLISKAIQNSASAGTLNLILTTLGTPERYISLTSDGSADTTRHTALHIEYTVGPSKPSSVALASKKPRPALSPKKTQSVITPTAPEPTSSAILAVGGITIVLQARE